MTVHTQPDYQIISSTPAPEGYPPAAISDTFSETPFLPDYESRRQAFLQHILKNPAPRNTKPAWYELARLAAGGKPHEGIFSAAFDFIDARIDCADFVLHGILRMLYLSRMENADQTYRLQGLSDPILQRARQSVLNFKYFPNEPGIDSLCTWTENHYILFSSAAFLAGQLYPDEVFTNSGETGRQKIALNRTRILHWLDLRFHTGFSEWLSHVYYDEDLTALLALYDFAEDDEIKRKTRIVLDLILLDMALNTFKGVFGSTHGRAYENTKKWASNEGTTDTSKLLFGKGIFSHFDNMSAIAFALSSYRIPRVIEKISSQDFVENRQRMGIRLSDMEKWNLHPDNFEDGMHTLTLEAYFHTKTIRNTLRMLDTCNWWENAFLSTLKKYRKPMRILNALSGLPLLAKIVEKDACRNTREEVNIYTYKTPDYMLSTAQDYRKGYGGDQQHIWQATLGQDAVCFTTHPAKIEGTTPNYWAGSGLLPRAAQYKNLAIIVYNIKKIPALYVPIRHFFTHAWLPKDKFDEVTEKNGWYFARKGAGYLALYSQKEAFWNTAPNENGTLSDHQQSRQTILGKKPEDFDRELVAVGRQNIWVCQMGRKEDDGEFSDFVERIGRSKITFSRLRVAFDSPGNGKIQFGWQGDLTINGTPFALHDYPRYSNPFSQSEFGSDVIKIQSENESIELKWDGSSG